MRSDFEITDIDLSSPTSGSVEQAATLTEQERVTSCAANIGQRHWCRKLRFCYRGSGCTLSAAATGNTELRARLKLQRDSVAAAARLSPTIAETIASQDPFTSTPAVAASVARHLCINLRRWDDGLHGWRRGPMHAWPRLPARSWPRRGAIIHRAGQTSLRNGWTPQPANADGPQIAFCCNTVRCCNALSICRLESNCWSCKKNRVPWNNACRAT